MNADQGHLRLRELLRLRALAFVAQLLLLVLALLAGAHAGERSPALLGILSVSALSHWAVATLWRRRALPAVAWVMGAILLTDTALLTAFLWLSGGPANPISVFYIVQVALAARLLSTGWAIAMGVVTSGAFASLFLMTAEEAMAAMHRDGGMAWHLRGMWVSYTLSAILVGYVVARLSRVIEQREAELREAEAHASTTAKLVALGTLAAGAAHELGTPLSTISLIAGELRHAIQPYAAGSSCDADLRLLQQQIERCREILQRMSGGAGQSRGESYTSVTAADLVRDVHAAFPTEAKRIVSVCPEPWSFSLPHASLTPVLLSLVDNALRASTSEQAVRLTFDSSRSTCGIHVTDEGQGMSAEVLARAQEPFFTTREPGQGMGLGLYLAADFARALRGSLRLQSTPGQGTTASLQLEASPSA